MFGCLLSVACLSESDKSGKGLEKKRQGDHSSLFISLGMVSCLSCCVNREGEGNESPMLETEKGVERRAQI